MRLAIKPLPDVISLFFLDEAWTKMKSRQMKTLLDWLYCEPRGGKKGEWAGKADRKTHIILQLIFDQRDGMALEKGEIWPEKMSYKEQGFFHNTCLSTHKKIRGDTRKYCEQGNR